MVRALPALWILGALTFGIAIADLLAPPCWCFALLGVVALTIGLLKRSYWFGIAAILLVFSFYAATRFCLEQQQGGVRDLSHLVERQQSFTVYATVADWPRLRERATEIKLAVDSLHDQARSYYVEGDLLLQVSDTTTLLQRGDAIVFTTRLYPLPVTDHAEFDYSRYLRLRGVHGRAYLTSLLNIRIDRRNPLGFLPLIDQLRHHTNDVFERCLSPQSAALAKGLMLGETREIDPEVYAMFRDSGTLHLLAVSGSNVALVLLVLHLLLRPMHFRPRVRYVVMLLVIVIYAGMCRGEPSVMRASVMASLVIGGRLLQRKINLNQIIALTAVVILLYEPAQFFDVGFQLSFITAWGLILAVPRLTVLFEKHHQKRWYRWLVFPLIVSLVAQVCSMPLSVLYFQRLPVLSIPANLIVVPLVSLCVFGLAALLLAYLILPMLGVFTGSLVDPIHRLVVFVLEQLGGGEMPVVTPDLHLFGRWAWLAVVVAYALLVIAIFAVRYKRARRLLVIGGIGCTTVLVSLLLLRTYTETARITITRIPGGAAVINPLGGGEADLIVSSLWARDYDVDQTILPSLLRANGVDSLARLFVLGADYAALDDLWRFSAIGGVDSIFAYPKLLPSFRETRPAGVELIPLCALRPVTSARSTPGYVVTSEGFHLRRPGANLLIGAPNCDLDRLRSSDSSTALLITSARPVTAATQDRLLRSGFAPIVANRLESPEPDSDQDPSISPRPLLVELKSLGYFALPLSDRFLGPFD